MVSTGYALADIRDALSRGQIKATVRIDTGIDTLDATVVLDPLYMPSEDTYQAVSFGYYNSTYLRILFNFTPASIYCMITAGA